MNKNRQKLSNKSQLGDALRLVNSMGVDHPQLSQACAALGIDVAELLRNTRSEKENKQTGRLDQSISLPVPEISLSKRKKWKFLVTRLERYQFINQGNSPQLPEKIKVPPLKIEFCKDPNRTNKLPAITDNRKFWRRTNQWLNYLHQSNQINEVKLGQHMAQLKSLVKLPLKERHRHDRETWLYIDYSESNCPLYNDFSNFTTELKRYLGVAQVSNVIEIIDMQGTLKWRNTGGSRKLRIPHRSALPIPNAGQQVIVLGDPLHFSDRRWQALLLQMEKRSKRVLRIGTRPQKDWHYWGFASDLNASDKSATEKLLSILSTTPGRFTFAMVRELRQKITGGSIAVECDLFQHHQLKWLRYAGNGYWAEPLESYQQAFTDLEAEVQCKAAEIIDRQLPNGTDSLRHEHQLLTAQLSVQWRKNSVHQQEAAKKYFEEFYELVKSQKGQPQQIDTALNFVYTMAHRMGILAEKMPLPVRETITQVGKQINDLIPQASLPPGTIPSLYLQEKIKQENKKSPGSLRQKANQWRLYSDSGANSDETTSTGIALLKLLDASRLFLNSKGRNLDLPQQSPPDPVSIGEHYGETHSETFTLKTVTSNNFYWAKSLSITSDGVVAQTENIKVSWPSSGERERPIIELLPSAPDWLNKFPPQLDDCGLYSTITIKDISFNLRYIPSGSFLMGSPESESERYDDETQHRVTLTHGYWLGETTVSQALWKAVMKKNPSQFKQRNGEMLPVESVSWDDCQKFCKQANKLLPGLELILPTEAQWEYACRAGTQTPFSTGQQLTTEQANYDGDNPYNNGKKGEFRERTMPVDAFEQNPWGLHQMHGNVWEWCRDAPRDYKQEAKIDPEGDITDRSVRAVRGGGWIGDAHYCRSAGRYRYSLVSRGRDAGLRVAQVTQESDPCPQRDLSGARASSGKGKRKVSKKGNRQ